MAITVPTSNSPSRSRLRLLHGRAGRRSDAGEGRAHPPLQLVGEQAHDSILVAGSDARRRGNLLRQLSARLPEGTRFQEAAATWELLERAPTSRMVMLAGEIDGSSAESVMHLLGNRHPQLPVLALSAPGAA